MEYQDYEERPEGEWVLFLCKRNRGREDEPDSWSAITFKNMDMLKDRFGNNCRTIFEGPQDLARYYGTQDLFDMYEYFNNLPAKATSVKAKQAGFVRQFNVSWSEQARDNPFPLQAPHLESMPYEFMNSRIDAANWLWMLLQQVCDRCEQFNSVNEVDDDEQFTIRLDRMTQPENMELIAKFNKQKRIICEQLIALGRSRAVETELKDFMHNVVREGILKTKQDPWRIFSYYAPELGDCGFLYYPGKRHKLDDHTMNV